MKYNYPLVVVTWLDACKHDNGDTAPRHIAMKQTTTGWLLKRDKHGVSVAGEYNSDDGTWRDEYFIPKVMIVKMETIKK